jgi:hypothetical protein
LTGFRGCVAPPGLLLGADGDDIGRLARFVIIEDDVEGVVG